MSFPHSTRGTIPATGPASAVVSGLKRIIIALWWSQALAWPCFATPQPQEADRIILWTGSMTPVRVAYEKQVLKLALEKSREKYGDYTFSESSRLLSTQRVERAIREGEEINVVSSPWWGINMDDDPPLTIIPIPIARGLLGYRKLIVRKQDLPRFAQVDTLAELQKLTAGLGSNWTELDVFRANRLEWFGGRDLRQLHFMLHRARFDYLPLGVVEVEESLETSDYHDQLAIVPGLIVFYPLPIFIQVSIARPELAERLEYGLRQVVADGSLNRLFNQYYGHLVKELRSQPSRVIILKSPNLPEFVKNTQPELIMH